MINMLSIILLCCASFLSLRVSCVPVQPNILFFLADDLGFNDIGYHNPYIKTPNIDELAHSGKHTYYSKYRYIRQNIIIHIKFLSLLQFSTKYVSRYNSGPELCSASMYTFQISAYVRKIFIPVRTTR